MSYCSKCGTQLKNGALFCSNCGEQAENPAGDRQIQYLDQLRERANKKSRPVRGRKINRNTPKGSSSDSAFKKILKGIIIAIGALIVIFLIIAVIAVSTSGNDKSDEPVKESAAADTAVPETVTVPAPERSGKSEYEAAAKKAVTVGYFDFYTEIDDYLGKTIRTTLYCDYVSENGFSTGSSGLKWHSVSVNLARPESSDLSKLSKGTFVTVVGKPVKDESRYIIDSAYIEQYGNECRKLFEDDSAAFEEAFKSKCVSVSYDDLMHYPDTYQETPICVSVNITDVRKETLVTGVFSYNISALLDGEEAALLDSRIISEPRICEGDYLTVYGFGDGLARMKISERKSGIFGASLFKNVVDEYYIPAVAVLFVD